MVYLHFTPPPRAKGAEFFWPLFLVALGMLPKNPDINLRPIIDELKTIDTSDTDTFVVFLRDAAEQIREAADAVSNAKLMALTDDKAVLDKFDIVRSQIRELNLLLYKMDHKEHYFDRLSNVLASLEEELKRVEE